MIQLITQAQRDVVQIQIIVNAPLEMRPDTKEDNNM